MDHWSFMFFYKSIIHGGSIMDKYFNSYREMISLRGLTGHPLKSYSTYIRSYLDYLQNILHKSPEDVSWQDLRDYIKWLQKEQNLSDRTVNAAISQLRFFTIYENRAWSFFHASIFILFAELSVLYNLHIYTG